MRKVEDHIVEIMEKPLLKREFKLRSKVFGSFVFAIGFLLVYATFNYCYPHPLISLSFLGISISFFVLFLAFLLAFVQSIGDDKKRLKYSVRKRKYIVVDYWIKLLKDIQDLFFAFAFQLILFGAFFFRPFFDKTLVIDFNRDYVWFIGLICCFCLLNFLALSDIPNNALKDIIHKIGLYFKRRQKLKVRAWRRSVRQFRKMQEEKALKEKNLVEQN